MIASAVLARRRWNPGLCEAESSLDRLSLSQAEGFGVTGVDVAAKLAVLIVPGLLKLAANAT